MCWQICVWQWVWSPSWATTVFGNSITLTNNFFHATNEHQLGTLIHEGSHIGLGTADHAYSWEPNYNDLHSDQTMQNADTIALFLVGKWRSSLLPLRLLPHPTPTVCGMYMTRVISMRVPRCLRQHTHHPSSPHSVAYNARMHRSIREGE